MMLLLVPGLTLGITLLFRAAAGPHYLGRNVDPDYAYLFNSLNLASGKAPTHIDHPGTTLQLWGMLVLRSVHLFSGHGPFITDVIQRSEFYLAGVFWSLAASYILTLYLLGLTACRVDGSLIFAVLCQSTILAFTPLAVCLPRVSPEIAILIMCNLLCIRLLKLYQSSMESLLPVGQVLLLGVLSGAAIFTKIVFLPLIILGLILFP